MDVENNVRMPKSPTDKLNAQLRRLDDMSAVPRGAVSDVLFQVVQQWYDESMPFDSGSQCLVDAMQQLEQDMDDDDSDPDGDDSSGSDDSSVSSDSRSDSDDDGPDGGDRQAAPRQKPRQTFGKRSGGVPEAGPRVGHVGVDSAAHGENESSGNSDDESDDGLDTASIAASYAGSDATNPINLDDDDVEDNHRSVSLGPPSIMNHPVALAMRPPSGVAGSRRSSSVAASTVSGASSGSLFVPGVGIQRRAHPMRAQTHETTASDFHARVADQIGGGRVTSHEVRSQLDLGAVVDLTAGSDDEDADEDEDKDESSSDDMSGRRTDPQRRTDSIEVESMEGENDHDGGGDNDGHSPRRHPRVGDKRPVDADGVAHSPLKKLRSEW
ncbi:hypothetical protein HYQ45_010558 [Verticillium longisporum]|uniref:Uncharacterized protein n=1 Tax=Verticillium longisporum TaxID=100787 RepID=A0A8I2ZIN1_VERLO|nr:hypothetical protein HYQ45_010558 [Verticillium longisporum]KAG7147376.1 hypothetical protein HYQ46_003780 [Verticillium longisporum]